MQIYSAMSETKAAFAECTLLSLKVILYRYSFDSIRYSSEFWDELFDLLDTKQVKEFRLLSVLCRKSFREYTKPKYKIGDRVRRSKYDLHSRRGYKPQFAQECFEIVAISSEKPATYTIKDEQDEIIVEKFHQKELIKVL